MIAGMQTAPYGSWTSPITAADLASTAHPVTGGRFVGGQVWWTELRPSEDGRQAVRRLGPDGQPEDVLPAPWNARNRVQEYGGNSWVAAEDGTLVFCEFSDQRLYRLDPGASEPVPISPAPAEPAGLRYADPQLYRDGSEVWCLRESHDADGTITRDLCAVPLDGSAAEDPAAVRSLVGGSDFLAHARLSPNGDRLAWIAWDHPQMPWDGTELRVAELAEDGSFGPARTVAGSSTESVMQPEWLDNDSLCAISDRTGWWNLYRIEVAGERARPAPAVRAGGRLRLADVAARHPLVCRAAGRPAAGRADVRQFHAGHPRSGDRHADRCRAGQPQQHAARRRGRRQGAAELHRLAERGRHPDAGPGHRRADRHPAERGLRCHRRSTCRRRSCGPSPAPAAGTCTAWSTRHAIRISKHRTGNCRRSSRSRTVDRPRTSRRPSTWPSPT